jgi:hypothetical protein
MAPPTWQPEVAADTTIENPLVHEVVEIIAREAARLASSSSEFTAETLLEVAEFYISGHIHRIQKRKISAWVLALKMERENAPSAVLAVKKATGPNKRDKVTGKY